MEIDQLPVNSDCYASWVLDDQSMTLTQASITITIAGATPFTQETTGSQLEILETPKRLRLKIRAGDITKVGTARVEITATDELGDVAKRRITPEIIRFW